MTGMRTGDWGMPIWLGCLTVWGVALTSGLQGREWKDASGNYVIEAELFGFDDEHVILQRPDKELGVLEISQLSAADQEYLKSPEAQQLDSKNEELTEKWPTTIGIELSGHVVDYAQKDVTIQRRRGRTYVNGRRWDNLPELYQKIIPRLIEHFEEVELPDDAAFQRWLASLRGQPRTFHVDGVVMEMANGDEFTIPFFVFTSADRRALRAGFSEWMNAQQDQDRRQDLAYRLEQFAAAYFQNQQLNRQIALINLNLQAINSGIVGAWEVTLYPAIGNPSPPMWVVVPARNSLQASEIALLQNPGFLAGSVRRLSR
ncbi:MAG: SHD1 domain-containing protein [Pirellulales bacterium]